MSIFGAVGKGLLKLIPGVGQAVGIMETIGDVAAAVGGETGTKIKNGLAMASEGLKEVSAKVDAGQLTAEQQLAMTKSQHAHDERMAELDLADIQGGRDLAKTEILSNDQYISRTRPQLLRLYGKAALLLIFSVVAVAFVAVFVSSVSKYEASFLIEIIKWALGSIMATFLMMYRAYVGKRTTEKLASIGQAPEGLLDKLAKIKGVI